ncbi:unnamed protein product [Strongylus vulgaris]|uniref:Uncharacterized protein n=1 Tax=Strongylus vulgaris TaxID=40348 RepID=A0A3P7IHY9_STRVU|nr:unnamed protein product [Strongylus vulgaris]
MKKITEEKSTSVQENPSQHGIDRTQNNILTDGRCGALEQKRYLPFFFSAKRSSAKNQASVFERDVGGCIGGITGFIGPP